MDPESVEAAGRFMQAQRLTERHKTRLKTLPKSWISVPKGKEREEGEEEREEVEKEEEEEEGNLTHSRSQQEMEQLLASAASDDEESEDNFASVPTFTIPEQPLESGVQQVSRVIGAGQRHASAASERLQSTTRILGLRGLSWLFEGGVANLIFPVLVLTHLALFGLGFYIGRRTNLVKTL